MMKQAILLSFLCSFLLAGAVPLFAGCAGTVPLAHSGRAGGGAFDLQGTQYEGKGLPGPKLRFWGYNRFAEANSGTQDQYIKRAEWLANPSVDYVKKDYPPGHWVVLQANWYGVYVKGCASQGEDKRSVVELSFADDRTEGTAKHKGYYLVGSVPLDKGHYSLDQLKGGSGPKGNVIAVRPIPVPEPTSSRGKKNRKDDAFMDVTLELEKLVSYSEKGINDPVNLISGVTIHFTNDVEPTSSKPDGYEPVLNPDSPDKPLGLVPVGKDKVKVSVPVPEKAAWFVTRVVYADSSAEILSNAVSGHSEPVKAPRGGLFRR